MIFVKYYTQELDNQSIAFFVLCWTDKKKSFGNTIGHYFAAIR